VSFETMQLPEEPTIVAPDGSDVRVLLQRPSGGVPQRPEGGSGRVDRPTPKDKRYSVDHVSRLMQNLTAQYCTDDARSVLRR